MVAIPKNCRVRKLLNFFAALGSGPIAFMFAMFALALLGSYPAGGVVSGTLDRVLFDLMARMVAHKPTGDIVVVNIDEPTLTALGARNLPAYSKALLDRMGRARSIVLDLPLAPGLDYGSLERGMQDHPQVILVRPSNATDVSGNPVLPLPRALADHAAAISQRDVTIGHYGVVTGFVPYIRTASGTISHIALDALRVARIEAPVPFEDYLEPYAPSVDAQRVQAVSIVMPPIEATRQYSYLDVVQGRIPGDAFAGKIVFVGHEAWLGEGTYQTSSLHSEAISRVQLDALITEAVASGSLTRKIAYPAEVAIQFVITIGIALICFVVPGRAMHLAALAWVLLIFAIALGLLLFHVWLPIGFLPVVCIVIYGFFASVRHHRTLMLLRREVSELNTVLASIQSSDVTKLTSIPALAAHGELRHIESMIHEIRLWQRTYVSMIDRLPYPVFLELEGRLAVRNDKANNLLLPDASDAADCSLKKRTAPLNMLKQKIDAALHAAPGTPREIVWRSREYVLLCEPLAEAADQHGQTNAWPASQLISLIDLADAKNYVAYDKEMLRHVAHDLRSPLTTILMLIERRSAETAVADATQHDHEFLRNLRRYADYSLRIAKEFMQLARAERLEKDTFVPIAPADIVRDAIDQVWFAAERKAIKLHGPEVSADTVLIRANPDMLVRAIVNLLDNAIKYSDHQTEIRVRIEETNDRHVALHISDQGIGMSDDTLRHLFEPFYQAERQHDIDGGVGLGLPFVRAVIQRHGGTIQVSSVLGRGTEFVIRLPLFP
ncbi:histidine kinase [Burkholderia thailandensis]|uniref:histidine kinase n=2 Tax=Burkholderia humptydooensis TaxID=430531 RepID=A0A7U4P953_9BURK|nr:his Kinase A domain protein [Burkholderia sp. 2002721687]ALX45259.1 histidine kinase [Burkholderia humptydooensis]ATF32288.1 histidine kinase [Burkholderia thailandensis]EIP85710.1 periplasmic sensor signal transduction histidine kinase [Burkholderia humptydooensis MSMB43]KST72353.1 histidine kinase [Burkholderia humptydooensis]